ncbi:MAG: hypothetical protein QY317_16280 [Candidatus Jettenia caeni]|nr:MAG: hypothetical protein QY317_16280 [Candidatus Jettenia caeni]
MAKSKYDPEKIIEIKINLRRKHLDALFERSRKTKITLSKIIRGIFDKELGTTQEKEHFEDYR